MTQPIDTSSLLPPSTRAHRADALEDLRNRKVDASVSADAPRSSRHASSDPSSIERPDDAALRKAAVEFESMLVQKMFESMRKSARALGGGGALGQEFAEGMLDEVVSKRASETGGIGLAPVLLEQWGVDVREPLAAASVTEDPHAWMTLRDREAARDVGANADPSDVDPLARE